MKLQTLILSLSVLATSLHGVGCSGGSSIQRGSLLNRRIPAAIQLTPLDSSFNHRRNFILENSVGFVDDTGRIVTGVLATDTSSIAQGRVLVSTMIPLGRGYLDELPRRERNYNGHMVGTTWAGNLKLYTIQQIDTLPGHPALVEKEMRSMLLFDHMGDTYILSFVPGCQFELYDEDSDQNGDFLRAGDDAEYTISGNSALQVPYYLLGRPAVARILYVELIKRTH